MTLAIPEAVFSDLHTFTTSHTNETFVTCAPYPHARELHPKIHSTASFLVFYVVPLFIISVYYCFIARSLVRSSADIPAEGHLHLQKQVSAGSPLFTMWSLYEDMKWNHYKSSKIQPFGEYLLYCWELD